MADGKSNQNQAAQSFAEMVTQWERNFDAFANQVMGTEAYSQAMNDMQKAQLSYQKNFNEFMTQQLATMNMPTREDIVQLTEMVQKLDRRLERIEDKLVMNDGPKQNRKRPARTRVPISPSTQAQATPEAQSNPEVTDAENTDLSTGKSSEKKAKAKRTKGQDTTKQASKE